MVYITREPGQGYYNVRLVRGSFGRRAQQDKAIRWQLRSECIESITPARTVAFSTFVTSTFRQRLRKEIDLGLAFSKGLKQAEERTLARWGYIERGGAPPSPATGPITPERLGLCTLANLSRSRVGNIGLHRLTLPDGRWSRPE